MKTKLISLIVVAAFGWSAPGIAGPIGLGAFAGGPEIDFEGAQGLAIPGSGPFSIDIVAFSEASTGSGGPGWRRLNCCMDGSSILTDNAGVSDIRLDLSAAQQRVGLEVGIGNATYEVRFFDAGLNLLGSVSQNLTGWTSDLFFAGWEHLEGITRVQIVELTQDNGFVGGLDNIRFEDAGAGAGAEPAAVPEPVTLALLGLGLATLGFRRRG